jgi:hypothetical protein
LGYLLPAGNKSRNLALQVEGISKIETIKYAPESHWTQTRERLSWRTPETTEKLQT